MIEESEALSTFLRCVLDEHRSRRREHAAGDDSDFFDIQDDDVESMIKSLWADRRTDEQPQFKESIADLLKAYARDE